MKAVAKILIDFEVPDSIAARRKLRELAGAVLPVLPGDGTVREFKITEDGTGRLIEKIDPPTP